MAQKLDLVPLQSSSASKLDLQPMPSLQRDDDFGKYLTETQHAIDNYGIKDDTDYYSQMNPPAPPDDNTVLSGITKVGKSIYDQVHNAGTSGLQHLREGNYPAAFHDVTAPITDNFANIPEAGKNLFDRVTGRETTAPSRGENLRQMGEMIGLPANAMHEDYQKGNTHALLGEALATAAMFLVPHIAGKMLEGHLPNIGNEVQSPTEMPKGWQSVEKFSGVDPRDANINFATKTEADLAAPNEAGIPQFNTRRPIGTVQENLPEYKSGGNLSNIGDRLILKKPSLEAIRDITDAGFQTSGVNEEGHIAFERNPEAKSKLDLVPYDADTMEPQEMRVPNTAEKGGLDNIAMGGASPRVLDVLGSSLYSNDRPTVIAKELLQNSFDEHRIAGQKEPIRLLLNKDSDNPSFTIRDYGRGMSPEQLYTKFTDLGETGKADEEGASGGFGFAKAAPMLAGTKVSVESIVKENGQHVKYSFEGTPEELKNQTNGVKLKREKLTSDIPTGLKVTTHFPKDTGMYNASEFIQAMTKNSPSITSEVHKATVYQADHVKDMNAWLNGKPLDKNSPMQHYADIEKLNSNPLPELRDEFDMPGAKVQMHFATPDSTEKSGYSLSVLNKGLYQTSDYGGYGGGEIPNVPDNIFANVHALVEEGHPDYPFTANREQLNKAVKAKIAEWIDENVVKGAVKNRMKALQKMYDDIQPISPYHSTSSHDVHILDSDGILTPELTSQLEKSPTFNLAFEKLEVAHAAIMQAADKLGWMKDGELLNKLQKFGLLFQTEGKKNTTLGIHIPNPGSAGKQSAILINLAAHLEKALESPNPVDNLASSLFTTITHEIAHIPGGGHDTSFAYRDADLRQALGRIDTNALMDNLGEAFGDLNSGQLNPEIQDFLSKFLEARSNATRKDNALLATGINSERPTNSERPEGTNGSGVNGNGEAVKSAQPTIHLKQPTVDNIKKAIQAGYVFSGDIRGDGAFKMVKSSKPTKAPILESEVGNTRPTATNARAQLGPSLHNNEQSALAAALNFPRTVMASMDMSAPLRQGLPLIHKKEFWLALDDMVKSFGSQKMFEQVQASIADKPLFKQRQGPNGKMLPSFAQDAGLRLTDIHGLDVKEEAFMSKFAQAIPGVKRSERAYVGFLNKLRADTFESLIENSKVLGADGTKNLPLARSIADFVNTATGRGSLGKLESSASTLNTVFFAPRLIASRVKLMNILNPNHYLYADPFIRKEALKSLFAMTSFGLGLGQLAKMSGAEVGTNPNNADFGKIKIHNVRIDPWAGFQQYVVAANRLLRPSWAKIPGADKVNTGILPIDMIAGFLGNGGQQTQSSTSGKNFDLWNPKTPFQPTSKSVAERFIVGKTNPIAGFIYALTNGRKEMDGSKMNFTTPNPFENSITERFTPILLQDLYSLRNTDPALFGLSATASFFGMGTQAYKGQ